MESGGFHSPFSVNSSSGSLLYIEWVYSQGGTFKPEQEKNWFGKMDWLSTFRKIRAISHANNNRRMMVPQSQSFAFQPGSGINKSMQFSFKRRNFSAGCKSA